MAEMTTAITSIKISDFLKICAKYKYYLPQSFEAELNNRTNEIVNVIYTDEYSPKWSIHRDHIIVNHYFSREMIDEIKKLKSLCSNKEQIILELIKSFNANSNLSIEQSVDCAIRQYEYFRKTMLEENNNG